jgi:nucleoside-diphosphate-sugar epimerase
MAKGRVLVTGGAGYIGSILCGALLDAGYGVTAVDNLLYGQPGPLHLCGTPGFEFIYGDVRDESILAKALTDADVIVPTAAIVGAPACDRDPSLSWSVNVEAVRLLARLRNEQQLIIFPTTNSGYGSGTDSQPCTEDMELNPVSLYARTKVQAEAEVMSLDHSIALRLATAFGASPRMRVDLLVNDFVHRAVTDGYIVLFEEDFRRNFVHVRDIAACVIFCIENAQVMTGRVYNVGLDSANMSKAQLVSRIKEHIPSLVALSAPAGKDPDQRDYIVSSDRLRRAGFTARRTLDDGIAELLLTYRMLPPSSLWRNA